MVTETKGMVRHPSAIRLLTRQQIELKRKELRKLALKKERVIFRTHHKKDSWLRLKGNKAIYLGCLAEYYLGYLFDWHVDDKPRPFGDSGIDFKELIGDKLYSIDSKAARNPDYMLVEEGRVNSVVFILSHYDEEEDWVRPLGWCWKDLVLSNKPFDTGHGIINHLVPMKELFKIRTLQVEQVNPSLKIRDGVTK